MWWFMQSLNVIVPVRSICASNCIKHYAFKIQNPKETLEEMEDDGNFLRRSVNDITSLLDINFGSLGRPTRGGRGRGARGGPTSRPERPKPILERVCSQL